ncbi:MAG: thioesterase [Zetaproteobacteria bacterium]|nr:thioesterase [Pseudobdellovibrionaceae bacterium]|tara:strand:+ start:182 stop:622 length:441 start_codon:yes stop_codon:yes gene_type:complete
MKKKITLENFSCSIDLRISWGEMDAYGHVNNCNYFRYFENSRIHYIAQMKKINSDCEQYKPILSRTSCKFIRPIYFPDNIIVGAKVEKLELDFYTMSYGIFQEESKKCMAIGEGTVVCFDYQNKKKVNLPESWKNAISQIEGFQED